VVLRIVEKDCRIVELQLIYCCVDGFYGLYVGY